MAGTPSSNRRTAVVLLLAMVVLVGAILAALTYSDDDKRTTTTPTTAPSVSTSRPSTTTTAPRSTTSTLKDLPGTGSTTTTAPLPPTTVEPAVPTPEQAATGLFAAYRSGDRAQAATFATEDVIAVLFAEPYSPPDGSFQGCKPDGDLFQCKYVQGAASYDMTAQRDPDTDSFLIVVITAFRPATTTTTTTTTAALGLPSP